MTQTILSYAVLIAALQQLLVPFFVRPFGKGHNAISGAQQSLIQPARYAFIIWFPIYLLALAYSLFQLFAQPADQAVLLQMVPWVIVLYFGSSLWLFVADRGAKWMTVPILAVMAASATAAFILSTSLPTPSAWWTAVVIVPFGLYAGWTVCATFVNLSSVLPQYVEGRFGLSRLALDMLCLAGALLVATVILWISDGHWSFAATVVWALAAIIIAVRQVDGQMPVLIVSTLGICIVMAISGMAAFGFI